MYPRMKGIHRGTLPNLVANHKGFTLVELAVTVGLLGISLALAIPAYRDMVQKRQLTNAAEQIAAFMSSAQSVASRTNEVVTVSFNRADHDDWCIGATMGETACDCDENDDSQTDYCEIDSQHFVLNESISSDSELMHSVTSNGGSYSFDPVRGAFNDMDDWLSMEMHTESRDYKLNLMVNATGRVILCSKDATHALPGYEICPTEAEEETS